MNREARAIDLNADLGEGFESDADVLEYVTSASVCCGAHAGNPEAIVATLRAAKARGVAVGAHPGYADREHFGRVDMTIGSDEVARLILDQYATLEGWARDVGVALRFVKPHGALYNQAQRDPEVARGVLDAVARLGLAVLGQPASVLAAAARERGLAFISEGFPDRAALPDGRLVPRGTPGAVLEATDAIAAQAVELAGRGCETLCLHGDEPRVVERAAAVRDALAEAGYRVASHWK